MGRSYFPDLDISRFDEDSKKEIEESIARDFANGFKGIQKLPRTSRFGVYVAYVYYLALFKKIKNTPSGGCWSRESGYETGKKPRYWRTPLLKHRLNLI
jgi:phytoene synthase